MVARISNDTATSYLSTLVACTLFLPLCLVLSLLQSLQLMRRRCHESFRIKYIQLEREHFKDKYSKSLIFKLCLLLKVCIYKFREKCSIEVSKP